MARRTARDDIQIDAKRAGWTWERNDTPYPNGTVKKLYSRTLPCGHGELLEVHYGRTGVVLEAAVARYGGPKRYAPDRNKRNWVLGEVHEDNSALHARCCQRDRPDQPGA